MKTHRFEAHSPEENRRLSNLGHLVEGAIFALVSIMAFVGWLGVAAWADGVWRGAAILAGLSLLAALYASHPRADWPLVWGDAQQKQHTLIAGLVMLGGAVDLISQPGSALRYVWPGALLLVGFLFLIHKQHGTSEAAARAVRRHQILGMTIMLSGFLRALQIFTEVNVFGLLWPAALFLAAVQLILYREPEGAYEHESVHH
jgi:hypothetical protein